MRTLSTLLLTLLFTAVATRAFSAASTAPMPAPATHTVLLVGDSLSSAHRIPADAGWVTLLQQRLDRSSSHAPTVINASRGGIVDEDAMVDALEAGRLAGAGLDVWRHEPQIDPRLLALPNVVLTPHMGSATLEGRVASGEKVIANIRSWVDGHRPPDQVLEGWA